MKITMSINLYFRTFKQEILSTFLYKENMQKNFLYEFFLNSDCSYQLIVIIIIMKRKPNTFRTGGILRIRYFLVGGMNFK